VTGFHCTLPTADISDHDQVERCFDLDDLQSNSCYLRWCQQGWCCIVPDNQWLVLLATITCVSCLTYPIDVDIIIRVLGELNESWARLIEVAVGIGLLSRQVGAVCIVPIILTVVSTQAQGWVSRRIGSRRKDWTAATQKRVNTTAAVLGSIQSVKMSGT
jgi:hypothetical protein